MCYQKKKFLLLIAINICLTVYVSPLPYKWNLSVGEINESMQGLLL